MPGERRTAAWELFVLFIAWGATTWLFLSIVYPALGVSSPAPVPVRILVMLAIAWVLLKRQGQTWSDLGLARKAPLFILALAVLLFAIKVLVAQGADSIAAALSLARTSYESGFFAHGQGNFPALLLWLLAAWVVGGFGEELVFRGFIMDRTAGLLKNRVLGWTLAVLLQALLFSFGHVYQGPRGMFVTGIAALTYGVFYLVSGKNLWPLILVHGAWDTLGLVLIYLKGGASL